MHEKLMATTAIGAGAGKLLGVRKIFARISPNLYEKFLCDFCLQTFSPHKDQKGLFWYDLQKTKKSSGICVFLLKLGTIFSNQTTLDAIFARIFRNF